MLLECIEPASTYYLTTSCLGTTMMDWILVLGYNSFFLATLVTWLYLTTRSPTIIENIRYKLRNYDATWFYLTCSILIIAILAYQLWYGVHNTDVDDAISTAVIAFLNGKNPYAERVTRHYPPSGGVVYSYYHYFPVDLLIHAGIYLFIGHFFVANFPTFWFVAGYLLLLVPTAWIFQQVINLPMKRSLMLYLILILPFLWTNSSLTLIGFLWGMYAWKVKQQRGLSIVIWIFSASSKYITGVFVFFLFLADLRQLMTTFREDPRQNDSNLMAFLKKSFLTFSPYFIGGTLFILTWIPFGIWEVIRGVFLYQGSLSERGEVAEIKGTLLVELLKTVNALDYYTMLFLVLVLMTIIIISWSYKNKPLHQFIVMSLILMLIFPFYGTELFCAPAAGMMIYLFRTDNNKEEEISLW